MEKKWFQNHLSRNDPRGEGIEYDDDDDDESAGLVIHRLRVPIPAVTREDFLLQS